MEMLPAVSTGTEPQLACEHDNPAVMVAKSGTSMNAALLALKLAAYAAAPHQWRLKGSNQETYRVQDRSMESVQTKCRGANSRDRV